jgi:hypothetical protein
MKNKLIYSLFAAILMMSYGCGDDFLDVQPTQFLTDQQVSDAAQTNPAIVQGGINGLYTQMFITGTGGTGGHDDFGQKGYDIFSDFVSGDMALSVSTYGWYRNITEFQVTQDFTFTDNYQPWRYNYRLIRTCNKIIAQLGGNDAVPANDTNKYLMGQAKAMRGHLYFSLLQFFVSSYDPTEPVLPLHNDPLQGSQPKSTQAEIYAQITGDLNDAITLLNGFTRSAKNEVDINVAKAMLAYVYGAMGNDAMVKTLTAEVMNGAGASILTDVTNGFNSVNDQSWIWGQDITLDNGLDLISWWGQVDVFTYSYAWAGDRKTIDLDLYNAIPANDARKAQFWGNPSSSYYLQPLNKFYAPARSIGGQRNIETDYVYMRIEEMYLLNAEASAKEGDMAGARTSLKAVMSQRVPDVTYIDALSGQALLDEIYLQTRIEFWGEGKSYFNLKRNKRSITRGANHLSFVGETIQYNDERLTFEIPQLEIQNNPFISNQNN